MLFGWGLRRLNLDLFELNNQIAINEPRTSS